MRFLQSQDLDKMLARARLSSEQPLFTVLTFLHFWRYLHRVGLVRIPGLDQQAQVYPAGPQPWRTFDVAVGEADTREVATLATGYWRCYSNGRNRWLARHVAKACRQPHLLE